MRRLPWAFFLILLSISTHAFAATISIPDNDAVAGAEVEIPVTVDDAKGMAGFQFTITYDASVLQATGAAVGELTSGWMITPNTTDKGHMKVAGVDPSLSGLRSGRGNLLNLRFKVIGKPKDRSSLKFTVCKLSDTAGNEIPSTCNQGDLKIKGKGKDKSRSE